jgi:hypothetical protein
MNHHAQLVRTEDISAYTHPETAQTILTTELEKIGIDDVRTITSQAQLRPATNTGQVFVIATTSLTTEAQNALLKLLEEPPPDTSFVLVVPPALQLLPTLQSRIGEETTITNASMNDSWLSFQGASYADRQQQIDDCHKTKDPQWLSEIAAGVHSLTANTRDVEALRVVQFVGQKLQTRGASNKMLLEHLALTLPLQE